MEMNRSASCWRAIRTRSSSVRNMSRVTGGEDLVAVQILEVLPAARARRPAVIIFSGGGCPVLPARAAVDAAMARIEHDDERTRLGVALKRTQAVCLGSGLGGGGRGDLLGKRLFELTIGCRRDVDERAENHPSRHFPPRRYDR